MKHSVFRAIFQDLSKHEQSRDFLMKQKEMHENGAQEMTEKITELDVTIKELKDFLDEHKEGSK